MRKRPLPAPPVSNRRKIAAVKDAGDRANLPSPPQARPPRPAPQLPEPKWWHLALAGGIAVIVLAIVLPSYFRTPPGGAPSAAKAPGQQAANLPTPSPVSSSLAGDASSGSAEEKAAAAEIKNIAIRLPDDVEKGNGLVTREAEAREFLNSLVRAPQFPAQVVNRLVGEKERRMADWFQKSPDGQWMLFRVWAGDWQDNMAAGLLYAVPLGGERVPRLVLENAMEGDPLMLPRFMPAGFAGSQLLVEANPGLYLLDLGTWGSRKISSDGWNATVSPGQTEIAYLSSYRTEGGANVWLFDLASGRSRRLTMFTGRNPGHGVRWVNENVIAFELETSGFLHSWTVQTDGNDLKLLGPGQLGDHRLGSLAAEDDPFPGRESRTLEGERHPETRLRLLSPEEVRGWPVEELRYAINEMYARRGADFRDREIKNLYSAFAWYQPRPGQTYDQTEAAFTAIEAENLKVLGEARAAKKTEPASGTPGNVPATPRSEPSRERRPGGGSLHQRTRNLDNL